MNAQDRNRQPSSGKAPVQVQTVYVLSPEQYRALEQKAMQGLQVREDTTPVQSGYINGVEHVLRLLRNGIVTQ